MNGEKNNFYIEIAIKESLSENELWYLFGLFAPISVIGIENPYIGKFFEEIKISENLAFSNLLSRKILRQRDDLYPEFSDTFLRAMIETCIKPEKFFWLLISKNEKPRIIQQHKVFFSKNQIVDVTCEGEKTYWLKSVRDINALFELLGFLPTNYENKQAIGEFVLEKTTFDSSVLAFDTEDDQAGIRILSDSDLEDTSLKALISALGEEGRSIIAINVSNASLPKQSHVQGLGYLEGRMGGWIINEFREKDTDFMRFQPGTVEEFRELIFSMVQ